MGCGASKQVPRDSRKTAALETPLVAGKCPDDSPPASPPRKCSGYACPKLKKIESGFAWEQTPSFTKRYQPDPSVEQQCRYVCSQTEKPMLCEPTPENKMKCRALQKKRKQQEQKSGCCAGL